MRPNVPQTMDPRSDYPLGTRRPDLVETPGGHRLAEITLEAARDGTITGREIRATPETLQRQAAIARASGRAPLAENLERAAELARVPDDELLAIYTALRPHRSTAEELEAWAVQLEGWGAIRTAAFVREATAAYVERGLLAV
jgi:propanediol dehydratase small subunit